jgi:asparagine synthase (glutamine-hydrolysing)
VGPDAPEWIAEVMGERALADAGVFEPRAVEQLWKKCQATGGGAQFSNADNMALVGVLSTGLLHAQLVRAPPARQGNPSFKTWVDREAPPERSMI